MQCPCAVLSFVACPGIEYFSALSHKRQEFRENVVERKLCVLILYTNLSGTFLILRRTERHTIKNLYLSLCTVPVIFMTLIKLEISGQIFKKYLNMEFQENPSSWSRVFPYGQTYMQKLIVAFRNFANTPNKEKLVY